MTKQNQFKIYAREKLILVTVISRVEELLYNFKHLKEKGTNYSRIKVILTSKGARNNPKANIEFYVYYLNYKNKISYIEYDYLGTHTIPFYL